MTQALEVRESKDEHRALSPVETIQDMEARFALAVRQRELLEDYIKDRLKPDKHFYTVPGGQKNSLTKEGAELVCLPHGLKPKYDKLAGPDQPPETDIPYQITVRCQLMRGNEFGGEGIGSASSHITRRDGGRVVRQTDPGLRHNATLKMAQKSAYIAATLNATAASEFFTQDMEDVGDAAPSDEEEAPMGRCPKHNQPFVHRQGVNAKTGKPYDFWACPAKDGNEYCKERPAAQAKGAPAERATDIPTPQPSQATPPEGKPMTMQEFWSIIDTKKWRPILSEILNDAVPQWLKANPGTTYEHIIRMVETHLKHQEAKQGAQELFPPEKRETKLP